jgi:hypothetical protein
MGSVRDFWRSLIATTAGTMVVSSAALAQLPSQPGSTAAVQSSDNSVIHLDQAWSQDDREWYYHFSQGSAVISYDIFLNLEVAGGQDLFRSDANSAQYGLIPEAANQFNHDALPIGISKTTVATPVKGQARSH